MPLSFYDSVPADCVEKRGKHQTWQDLVSKDSDSATASPKLDWKKLDKHDKEVQQQSSVEKSSAGHENHRKQYLKIEDERPGSKSWPILSKIIPEWSQRSLICWTLMYSIRAKEPSKPWERSNFSIWVKCLRRVSVPTLCSILARRNFVLLLRSMLAAVR